MSNNWDIDVDHEDFEDAPRELRAAYKALRKRFDSVTTERDDYRAKWETRAADDALSGFGFRNSKRVTKDLVADGVDLSDTDAVKAWVEENGDDYARETQAPATETGQEADHSEEQQARGQIAEATSQAQPAQTDALKAALAEITPEMTGDDVIGVYRKHGLA